MANAGKDENGVSSLLGTLNSDGRTVVPINANPTSHRLSMSDGVSGSDNGPKNAPRDENDVPALMGVSSVDGRTPVPIYADSLSRLLVNKN